MKQIVDEAREAEYWRSKAEQKRWCAEQREQAPKFLAMLRGYVPSASWQEVESFLSTRYGCECLYDALERERKRSLLLLERPTASAEEVENYLDTGHFVSRKELSERRKREESFRQAQEDDLPF